jgi:chromosome segregation ATPase
MWQAHHATLSYSEYRCFSDSVKAEGHCVRRTMNMLLIVLLEVLFALLTALVVLAVLLRARKHDIQQLEDINQRLLEQIAALYRHNDERKEGEGETLQEVEQAIACLDSGWDGQHRQTDEDMQVLAEQIAEQQQQADHIVLLAEQEGINEELRLQIRVMQTTITKTSNQFNKTRKELERAKTNLTDLRARMKEAGRKLQGLSVLENKEERLQRDRERLKQRLDKMKAKQTEQSSIIKTLRKELNKGTAAEQNEDLTLLRDELEKSEQALQRALREKQFIESHFISLDEIAQDGERMREELNRAKREIQTLEKSVLESHQDSKPR